MKETKADTKSLNTGNEFTTVTTAFLHSAIMIDGRTESTITKMKVPSITKIEWTPNFTALLIHARQEYIIPSAAVKQSIV